MDAPVTIEPQVCGISVSGKRHATVLGDVGSALLIVKNQRGLTLVEMGEDIKKSDDTVARIIAGETEMGVVTWLRAIEAYPELPELVAESAHDRALRDKQRTLDLEITRQREKAA
jgi:hypothetical protein